MRPRRRASRRAFTWITGAKYRARVVGVKREGRRATSDEERMKSVEDDGGCVGRGSGGRCGWAEWEGCTASSLPL